MMPATRIGGLVSVGRFAGECVEFAKFRVETLESDFMDDIFFKALGQRA
jgi:hypothetical protein